MASVGARGGKECALVVTIAVEDVSTIAADIDLTFISCLYYTGLVEYFDSKLYRLVEYGVDGYTWCEEV